MSRIAVIRYNRASAVILYAEYFAGTNLSLNSSTYYALLADVQTQTTGQYVFSVGYSRSLDQRYIVVTSGTLPPGRYSFDLIAVLTVTGGIPSLVTAAALVERTTYNNTEKNFVLFKLQLSLFFMIRALICTSRTSLPAAQSCVNQSFGICSQLCSVCNASSTCKYGYQCSCLEGYILQLDGYTCLANGIT